MLNPRTILLAILLTAATASAIPPETEAQVDAAIRAAMDKQELVGLAVAIVEHGEVAFTQGYGFADRAADIPVDEETMFRWASISKPVTAVAALQLAAEETLDLDADVRTLVPEFPEKSTDAGPAVITTRQLLCHQGGIVHYRNGPVIRTRRSYDEEHPYESVINALDLFRESPLVAHPGTGMNYTTHGYILASAVVERAGKAPFWEQVRTRIAEPCEMTSFRPDYQWEAIPNRAVGYRRTRDGITESTDTDVSWKLGGGGFISNIDDLGRFACGMIDDRLLDQASREAMWTPQPIEGRAGSYGLGIGVSGAGDQLRLRHTGSQEKTRTLLVIHPGERRAVAVMSNSEWANCQEIYEAIAAALASASADSATPGS